MPLQALIGAYIYRTDQFLAFGRSRVPGQLIFYSIGIAIFFTAAWLSWHVFEKHFLKLKRFFPMRERAVRLVDGNSDVDKNGESQLSKLVVGDKVTFSLNGTTIDKLHAGDEAKNMPARPTPSSSSSTNA